MSFGVAIAFAIVTWGETINIFTLKGDSGPLVVDDLTAIATILVSVTGIAAVGLSWRDNAAREAGHGEFFALMLTAAAGMVVLAGAQNLITVFIGYELLSIPLYVLCATEIRRASSLESGLKYLIVGSVGSATLLYGLSFLYGATGDTDFSGIAKAARRRSRRRRAARDGRGADTRRHRVQVVDRTVPPVDARRLRRRTDAGNSLHVGRHEGRGLRPPAAPLRRRADRPQGRLAAAAGSAQALIRS